MAGMFRHPWKRNGCQARARSDGYETATQPSTALVALGNEAMERRTATASDIEMLVSRSLLEMGYPERAQERQWLQKRCLGPVPAVGHVPQELG